MIVLIILSAICLLFIFLSRKYYRYDNLVIFTTTMYLVTSIFIFFHILFWSIRGYEYNVFVAKREAFVLTLESARKSGNEIELAAVVSKISEWNESLFKFKVNRKTFLIRDYTDPRIMKLEPIR